MIRFSLYKKLKAASGPIALDVELSIHEGSFVALCGPSGTGKTTLLRLIAGLNRPDRGAVFYKNICWLDTQQNIWVPPQRRKVGFVFQDYALFPNMSIKGNLQFAAAKNKDQNTIAEIIEVMELQALANRYPHQLSGGQQQRVALARALVAKPSLLLLDEPLSALDPSMRQKLQNYLLKIHERFKLTTILVSHDYREIFKLADRFIHMEAGRIISEDLPHTLEVANAQKGSIQLKAELIGIEENDSNFQALLMIGENIIKIPLPPGLLKKISIGQQVTVRFEGGELSFLDE